MNILVQLRPTVYPCVLQRALCAPVYPFVLQRTHSVSPCAPGVVLGRQPVPTARQFSRTEAAIDHWIIIVSICTTLV